ncbi:MAG: hypothetical protein AAF891_07540 [Pseudomonadota bacterium]
MTSQPFVFRRSARRPKAILTLLVWWLGLALIYVGLNAHPGIIALLGLFTLPALYDIGAGNLAELRIDEKEIAWRSGRRAGDLPRGALKTVRLDTRLDFSLRMTLHTHQGQRLRLPYECVPRAQDLKDALTRQDIPFEHHHFALMG